MQFKSFIEKITVAGTQISVYGCDIAVEMKKILKSNHLKPGA
jgi:hypothetical protein